MEEEDEEGGTMEEEKEVDKLEGSKRVEGREL